VFLLDEVSKDLDAGEDYGKAGCGVHLHQDLHWVILLYKCAMVRVGQWWTVGVVWCVKCCIIGFWFGCCYILLSPL